MKTNLKSIEPGPWKFNAEDRKNHQPDQADQSDSQSEEGIKPKQADILIRLLEEAQFFHTSDREPFVTINKSGHFETYSLRSEDFKHLLSNRYHKKFNTTPNQQALNEAVSTLIGKAVHEGLEQAVYTRVVPWAGEIFLDLANERWEAIRITKDGWSVVTPAQVKHRRCPGIKRLPTPIRGGSIKVLRPFLNLNDDISWPLIVGFLLAALNPQGPYPILVIYGEQGSGKSNLTRVLRALIDPCTGTVRSLPRDERDLIIWAKNGQLIAFDNVSYLPNKISDALCRLSTGGGYSTRRLYTDSEEIIFEGQRPIILNSITEVAVRGDLRDRSIIIDLPPLHSSNRRDERILSDEFEKVRPQILGILLTAISSGLRNLPDVHLQNLPRMADFIRWVTACETGLGWTQGTIANAYRIHHDRNVREALELDSLAQLIVGLMSGQGQWQGIATQLYEDLQKVTGGGIIPFQDGSRGLPGNARALSTKLRRLAPNLRHIGIEIEFQRNAQQRLIIIKKFGSFPSSSSFASPFPKTIIPQGLPQ